MQSGFGMGTLNHDNSGNIFLPGEIDGSITFDTIYTGSSYDGYLAKFSSNLNGLNVKYVSDVVASVTFDTSGNTYVIGLLHKPVSYIDTFTLYNSSPNPSFHPKIFLAKLDATGKCLWVKQGWNGGGMPGQIFNLGGNLYMWGRVDSCFLFDTATICNTRPIGSSFLAKLNTDGEIEWAKNYTSAKSAFFSGMSIDNFGNSYVIGWLDSTINIGGILLEKTAGSNRNTFIAKYNIAGNVIWAKQIPCTGDMLGQHISTDNNGNSYVTGNFSGTATFGNDIFTAQSNSYINGTRFGSTGTLRGCKKVR